MWISHATWPSPSLSSNYLPLSPMQRADLLLVTLGLARSRAQAQKQITAGQVRYYNGADWRVVKKTSLQLPSDTQFQITSSTEDRFVSRGALKLLGALEKTQLDVTGFCALDVGQSTGGFTDCLLQAGAARVIGVDVGRDQLASSLRQDPRVACLEGINARDLPAAQLLAYTEERGFDLAVMDVSFISQTLILPGLSELIKPGGHLVSLVKPQFEVGKAGIGKGGIVRDKSLYPKVAEKISQVAKDAGLYVKSYTPSPITGGDGNREFLLHATKI